MRIICFASAAVGVDSSHMTALYDFVEQIQSAFKFC